MSFNFVCPVCNYGFTENTFDEFVLHSFTCHPAFFSVYFDDFIIDNEDDETDTQEPPPIDPDTLIEPVIGNADFTCSICLEELADIPCEIRRIRACGHCFCEDCITRWLLECSHEPTCPLCSTVLCDVKVNGFD